MPNTNEPQVLSPKGLADQLFDAALGQVKGNYREAAGQVILFLKEALMYAVAASATDEASRKALLKSVGEAIATSIAAAPGPGGPDADR